MAKYRTGSGNSRTLSSPFRLSSLAILLYLLLSLIILSLLNFRVIWHALLNYSTGPFGLSGTAPLTDSLLRFEEKLNAPLLMVFWAVFGGLVYGIIWLIQNVLFTIEKDVEQSHYLKGGAVPIKDYWHKIWLSSLPFLGIAAAWIIYLIVFFRLLLPLCSNLFFDAFYEPILSGQILDVAGAVVLNAAALYLFWAIQHILTYSWRASRP